MDMVFLLIGAFNPCVLDCPSKSKEKSRHPAFILDEDKLFLLTDTVFNNCEKKLQKRGVTTTLSIKKLGESKAVGVKITESACWVGQR